MKKYIFNLALFLLVVCFGSHAQISRELLIADYLYNHYAFNEAIEHYEKITNDVNDPATLGKLGDCYRLTKNLERAADWYKEAYQKPGCPNYVKLHYAQTLMTLGRYQEALPLFIDYQEHSKPEKRIANMIASCEKNGEVGQAIPNGTIIIQKFNTDGMEFGPAIRKGQLVFTTDTVLSGTADKTDKWTGNSFFQMYKVDCEENGTCDHEIEKISKKVNTKYHDGPCSFTKDGGTMYFTRTNHTTQLFNSGPVADPNDVVHLQIMVANGYDSIKQDYKKVKRFHYNSHSHSTAHPAIDETGNWLVFTTDIPGGEGGTDLYMTFRDEKGKWSKPKNLGKTINTEGDELFPYISGDSMLYFTSNGHIGLGGLDVYKAKWDKTTETFSEPVNLGKPVNSSYDDMSFVIQDFQNAFFASNRPSDKKGDNIYSFHKAKINLSLKVIDAITGEPISSSSADLKSEDDDRHFVSDNNGTIKTQLFPNNTYTANINKPGYDPGSVIISSVNTGGITQIEKVVKLNPITQVKYHVVILDEKTKQPIETPQLVFIENETMKIDTIDLQTGQVFYSPLMLNKTYNVYGIKQNFYGNERLVSTKKIKPGIAVTVIYDTIYMTQLTVGGIYKIDNIYYDYNKATIRDDAKPSLERLLDVLNKYPNMRIQLNSHTDCRGSDVYNYKLSNSRAHSVMLYLKEKGISENRLKYKGFGETVPVNNCKCESCTEEQHQGNRRTEFQIMSLE